MPPARSAAATAARTAPQGRSAMPQARSASATPAVRELAAGWDRLQSARAPWRDLPEEVMNWQTASRRLQRWTAAGVWGRILAELRFVAPDAGWDTHMLDSSVIRARAPAHAAGAPRAAGEQALGRSRGGFSTKLHQRADAHGRPVALFLTGGERHDLLERRAAVRTGRLTHRKARPGPLEAERRDR